MYNIIILRYLYIIILVPHPHAWLSSSCIHIIIIITQRRRRSVNDSYVYIGIVKYTGGKNSEKRLVIIGENIFLYFLTVVRKTTNSTVYRPLYGVSRHKIVN